MSRSAHTANGPAARLCKHNMNVRIGRPLNTTARLPQQGRGGKTRSEQLSWPDADGLAAIRRSSATGLPYGESRWIGCLISTRANYKIEEMNDRGAQARDGRAATALGLRVERVVLLGYVTPAGPLPSRPKA